MKVILKFGLGKYINDGNWDYFTFLLSGNPPTNFACGLEIPLSITAKSSTYQNYGIDETRTKKTLIPSG